MRGQWPSAQQQTDQMIVVFPTNPDTVPLEIKKSPGLTLGLNLEVVKKRHNESMSQALDRVQRLPAVAFAEADAIVTANARKKSSHNVIPSMGDS